MDFYDTLAPYYHLIFADWEASMRRQGEALDRLIRAHCRRPARTVFDAACGIGTQALPLAARGYAVTGSDLAPASIERAKREAAARGLTVDFRVGDMRKPPGSRFDAVIACDNAMPHLLTDADLLQAFEAFYHALLPGGLCLVSVRDYEAVERGGVQVHPYAARTENGTRYVLMQVWEWRDGSNATASGTAPNMVYDTTMYVIEHPDGAPPAVHASRTAYYAVSVGTLMQLMERAGFGGVQRADDVFYQPVLIGHRPPDT